MSTNHKENIDRLVDLAVKCIHCSDEMKEQTGQDKLSSLPVNGSNRSYSVSEPIPLYIPTQTKK